MTPAEKAYNEYRDSVDNNYAGGLIPEITNYVDELRSLVEEIYNFTRKDVNAIYLLSALQKRLRYYLGKDR